VRTDVNYRHALVLVDAQTGGWKLCKRLLQQLPIAPPPRHVSHKAKPLLDRDQAPSARCCPALTNVNLAAIQPWGDFVL
jgi:hypothetical protein